MPLGLLWLGVLALLVAIVLGVGWLVDTTRGPQPKWIAIVPICSLVSLALGVACTIVGAIDLAALPPARGLPFPQ